MSLVRKAPAACFRKTRCSLNALPVVHDKNLIKNYPHAKKNEEVP